MSRRRVSIAFAGLLVSAACGNKFGSNDDDGGADGTSPDAVVVFSDGGADAGTLCSGDLHEVIDGNGHVIQVCPFDQGCAGGMCVPACQAASANKSSVGCDYYVVPPTEAPAAWGVPETCLAAFVANTWGSPVTLTVGLGTSDYTSMLSSYGYIPSGSGQSLTYTALSGGQVPVGAVAILFLSGQGCPEPTATQNDVSASGTEVTDVFHVTADRPAVLYDIFPYGGGNSAFTSATLLLPTSAWDNNYIATSGWSLPGPSGSKVVPWIAFVAQQDGTEVGIVPTADIAAAPGVMGTSEGNVGVYDLNAGQMLRIDQVSDLTGSIVKSNYPIGSWGGHDCTDLDGPACDGMHQQIPPVRALGSSYVAVRFRNRLPTFEETPPWRFVGAVNDTQLTYDPPQPGAPTTLNQRQLVEWHASGPFVVSSQDSNHPFYFGAHMQGTEVLPGNSIGCGSAAGCPGDPEMVNVIPPNQWLSSYIFFTDPTYPETNLVFVRKRAQDGQFHDVTLDCAGVLTGWQDIGGMGAYQYTRADLQTGNFSKVGACDNGRNSAHSDEPFALTVWGWGSSATGGTFGVTDGGPDSGFYTQCVSYAYPAGASVQPINTVVVVPN